MVRGLHELGRVFGKAGLLQRLLEHGSEVAVGVDGLAAAAQDDGVAGLEAENGRVDGDVGAGLVDHGNDAERHAHLADEQAVGALPLAVHGADGIGHVGHVDAGLVHLLDNGRREGQAVEAGRVEAELAGLLHVLGVDGNDVLPVLHEQPGQGVEHVRLGLGAGAGHEPGGLAGPFAHLAYCVEYHKRRPPLELA